MTNVITRYFESAERAHAVRRELVHRRRFSGRIVRLYEEADGLADLLAAEDVSAKTAQAYQKRIAQGGAVLMVRAGHKPLAVAKTTRDVTAQMGAVPLDGVVEEVFIKDPLKTSFSVLKDHPHMMTRAKDPYETNVHMADWPIPLISRRKPAVGLVIPANMSMTGTFFALTNRRKPSTRSIFAQHARMANFLLPLISKRKPFTGSIFAPHARMANFPISLISRRKPFTGTIIGRHTRMAGWPFPHLINGKTGENALIPNGPRMAAFPIPLLSNREPSNKSIFARHARMANFPIPLTSRREPFTGSIFPKHARMADMILPLVTKHSDKKQHFGSERFSLSRMLGLPTISRR